MSQKLSKIIENLPDYVKSYIFQNKDFQQDILENKLTDEEILWEADFQIEQVKKIQKPITIRFTNQRIHEMA